MLLAREMISSPAAVVRVSARFALEHLNTEVLFQQLQLAADAGLRGMQLACRSGDVQAIFVDRDKVAQLLEFHELGRPLSLNIYWP